MKAVPKLDAIAIHVERMPKEAINEATGDIINFFENLIQNKSE